MQRGLEVVRRAVLREEGGEGADQERAGLVGRTRVARLHHLLEHRILLRAGEGAVSYRERSAGRAPGCERG